MNRLRTIGFTALSVILLALPQLVLAVEVGGKSAPTIDVSTLDKLFRALDNAKNTIVVLFFVVASFFFLWAAFEYLRAGGDPTALERAKNLVVYGAIGIVLAIFALSLPALIATFFG